MNRFLIVFVLFTASGFAFAQEKPRCDVFATLEHDVRQWTEQDHAIAPPHRRFISWGHQQGEPTSSSALLIHGLYNSPEAMVALVDTFTDQGFNTLVTRLSGHRDADPDILKKHIQWQTWLEETEKDFELAQKLGKKVILVGHSTGALLATWLAAKHPQDVKALVLFSPAFGVSRMCSVGAQALHAKGISLQLKGGRLITGHAGIEVGKACAEFAQWSRERLRDALSSVPIWMVNTQLDFVIDQNKAKSFFKDITLSSQAPRVQLWLPFSARVQHDSITTPLNPKLPEMKQSLRNFLTRLEL